MNDMPAAVANLTFETAHIERAFMDACLLDATALKPGNVGIHGAGHGMEAADFIRSARAAARPIAASGRPVGQRIHDAIVATRKVVQTNTNLGIVLLCAPLAQAAYQCAPPLSRAALHAALKRVLHGLTVADAQWAFDAIRLANPGGLGRAARHDVHQSAQATLLEAMREAADRDSIARQYATAYEDILELGLKRLDAARALGCDRRWSATEVFLVFMASLPDSHIARKFGLAQAQFLCASAAEHAAVAGAARTRSAALRAWDVALKARGLNPGTSADLTVVTLFWDGLLRADGLGAD